MSNITQVVSVDKNLTSLKKGVYASDLDQLLSSRGPFTFFAPSDSAFGKLQEGALNELLEPKNKERLTGLLNNHIVDGKISFAELKDGDTLTNLNGDKLAVAVNDGQVSIGDAVIVANLAKAFRRDGRNLDELFPEQKSRRPRRVQSLMRSYSAM
ncbi:MAG: hypothetical protein EOO01_41835, partial [Chitinophagaceae bacterium]